MTIKREARAFRPLEVRSTDDAGLTVAGYAAVFGQATQIGDLFVERIERGAFTDTLQRRGVAGAADDVIFVINHNSGLLLARTRSGTLRLNEDDHGLHVESTLDPIDPDAVRVVQKMKRGDLDSMSFAFASIKEEWVATPGILPVRTLQQVELFDVSVVTDPAYGGTEIGFRSAQDVVTTGLPAPVQTGSAALARMRMKHGIYSRQSA